MDSTFVIEVEDLDVIAKEEPVKKKTQLILKIDTITKPEYVATSYTHQIKNLNGKISGGILLGSGIVMSALSIYLPFHKNVIENSYEGRPLTYEETMQRIDRLNSASTTILISPLLGINGIVLSIIGSITLAKCREKEKLSLSIQYKDETFHTTLVYRW